MHEHILFEEFINKLKEEHKEEAREGYIVTQSLSDLFKGVTVSKEDIEIVDPTKDMKPQELIDLFDKLLDLEKDETDVKSDNNSDEDIIQVNKKEVSEIIEAGVNYPPLIEVGAS